MASVGPLNMSRDQNRSNDHDDNQNRPNDTDHSNGASSPMEQIIMSMPKFVKINAESIKAIRSQISWLYAWSFTTTVLLIAVMVVLALLIFKHKIWSWPLVAHHQQQQQEERTRRHRIRRQQRQLRQDKPYFSAPESSRYKSSKPTAIPAFEFSDDDDNQDDHIIGQHD